MGHTVERLRPPQRPRTARSEARRGHSSRHGAGERRSSPLRIDSGQNDRLQSFALLFGEADEEPSDRSRARVPKEQPLLSIAARESADAGSVGSETLRRYAAEG